MPCLFDIAFREIKRNGVSPIEQLLATGSIKNKFQREYLSGLNQPRISLFEVVECHAENGSLKLHDLLFPGQCDLVLYDIGFSSTTSPGCLLFTTAVPVYDAFITSGAAFAFDIQWKDFILRDVDSSNTCSDAAGARFCLTGSPADRLYEFSLMNFSVVKTVRLSNFL